MLALSLLKMIDNYFNLSDCKELSMGLTEIGVIVFLGALIIFGYLNSRKVAQELKKMGLDK